MTKALTAEQEKIKASGKYVGVFPFEFDDTTAAAEIPSWIHLIPIGEWDHNAYGPIIITASGIAQFKKNFDAQIRKGVFITAGHEGFAELPAQGWITKVEARDTGLWGMIDWTQLGKETLSDKQYKFFSPEFYLEYADPETHEVYQNVLTGGALTKSPYFKELEAVVFSDKNISTQIKDNTMDIKTILKKKFAERTAEEVKFLADNKAKFDDADTAQVSQEETDAAAAKEKETGDANEAAGKNRDGSEKVQASTKVLVAKDGKIEMSEAEYKALTGKADQGAAAFAELNKAKLNAVVSKLVMSETNKAGRFAPKSETNLRAFIEKLDDAQRTQFSDLIAQLPEAKLFKELGATGAGEGASAGTVAAELDQKVSKVMADDKLSYSEALRKVFSDNKGLEDRYDAELRA